MKRYFIFEDVLMAILKLPKILIVCSVLYERGPLPRAKGDYTPERGCYVRVRAEERVAWHFNSQSSSVVIGPDKWKILFTRVEDFIFQNF